MAEYRIVRDRYAGYEVQIRRWWLPIWLQVGINTRRTVQEAERFAEEHARYDHVVKYLGNITESTR